VLEVLVTIDREPLVGSVEVTIPPAIGLVNNVPAFGIVEVTMPDPIQVATIVEQGPAGPLQRVKTINSVSLAGDGNMELSYVHEQIAPSASWTVTHGLSKWPSVTVVDSAGSWVIGEVAYLNENTVSLVFASAFSGKAFFN
jgi:hypothetical protein